MKHKEQCDEASVVDDVPISAILKPVHERGYGSVLDLPDEELADPYELERQVIKAELGPVLLLPRKGRKDGYCPVWDCSEEVGFDAFGTVDFERGRPEFDKAKYKADKLKEQLKDLVILIAILNERIPGKVKYKVLKYVRMGIIEADEISDWDMWQLAKLYMKAIGLRKQIEQLREISRLKKERQFQVRLDLLG